MSFRQALIAKGVIKSPSPPAKKPEVPVLCPLCRRQIAVIGLKVKKNLLKHLEKDHPLKRPELPKIKLPTKSKYLALKDHNGSRTEGSQGAAETVVSPPLDPMDANRGMGAFARENGRFGSHALHDRFDDESMP
jgi:hypothetical protein